MCEMENVFLNSNEHQRADATVDSRDSRFVRETQEQFPLHQYHRLAPLMHELRVVKSEHEIAAIQAACDLTGKGFRRALKFAKPGVDEAGIEAVFAHEFIRHKGAFAYPPIIAGGANNNILHYNQNDQPCKKGDLLLLDVAAGLGNYMSDLTRTIPVSGKFSKRQKQVYNAVLRIFRAQVAALTAGKTTKDLRLECEERTAKECVDLGLLKLSDIKKQKPDAPAVKKYIMHGVSHSIGLDVHDVMNTGAKIAPGWVLTVEPAIYIPQEGFGVRIENTVLVTENGPRDLMAGIPIEAGEIEALMGR
jgi:Xaa-Pro aminopeptidase